MTNEHHGLASTTSSPPRWWAGAAIAAFLSMGCSTPESPPPVDPGAQAPSAPAPSTPAPSAAGEPVADVIAVSIDGARVSVTLRSDDTGCTQYADWWEVLDAQTGDLLGRRILAHSHVPGSGDGNPFTRSANIDLGSDRVVVVRGHMNEHGFGGQVMRGSANSGFTSAPHDASFAPDVESLPPQPGECAF